MWRDSGVLAVSCAWVCQWLRSKRILNPFSGALKHRPLYVLTCKHAVPRFKNVLSKCIEFKKAPPIYSLSKWHVGCRDAELGADSMDLEVEAPDLF